MMATIRQALSHIQKKHGDVIVRGIKDQPAYSTGSVFLDKATGIGGVPIGRLVEIYGPWQSGKTTLSLHIAKVVLETGKWVAFLDYEHSLDTKYASSIGLDVNNERWLLVQPDSLEQGKDIVMRLIGTGDVGLIVVDSLAAMVPQAVIDDPSTKQKMLQARGIAAFTREVLAPASKNGATIIMTNHERTDVGKAGPAFGAVRTTTPGGVSPKFYAGMRLELRVVEVIKGQVPDVTTGEMVKRPIATKVRCMVTKNKFAPPYREATVVIWFGKGVYETPSVLEVGIAANIVDKKGGIYKFSSELVQAEDGVGYNSNGALNTFEWLDANPEIYQRLRALTLDYIDSFDKPPPEAETQVPMEESLDADDKQGDHRIEVGNVPASDTAAD